MVQMARIVPMMANTTNRITTTPLPLRKAASMPRFTSPATHAPEVTAVLKGIRRRARATTAGIMAWLAERKMTSPGLMMNSTTSSRTMLDYPASSAVAAVLFVVFTIIGTILAIWTMVVAPSSPEQLSP